MRELRLCFETLEAPYSNTCEFLLFMEVNANTVHTVLVLVWDAFPSFATEKFLVTILRSQSSSFLVCLSGYMPHPFPIVIPLMESCLLPMPAGPQQSVLGSTARVRGPTPGPNNPNKLWPIASFPRNLERHLWDCL